MRFALCKFAFKSTLLTPLFACLFVGSAPAAIYSVIDLGTLGGSHSYAFGINASGQIVGESTTTGNAAQHAFRYDGGTMTDLGTLGGSLSSAFGINASGQVVGESTTTGNAAWRAFRYDGGTMTDLGTLGGSHSSARGINASGQVVGFSHTTGNAAQHAFLYSGGTMTDLNSLVDPGWTIEGAFAINDAGQIAAYGLNNQFEYRALLLTPTAIAAVPEPVSILAWSSFALIGYAASAMRRQRLYVSLRPVAGRSVPTGFPI